MIDIPSREPRPIEVPIDGTLSGFLLRPQGAVGLVIFAHGSGSNKFSRRNRLVAEVLNRGRLATLLIDLLNLEEQEMDEPTRERRLGVPLLAERLIRAVDWAEGDPLTADLPLGLFGANTGAAAALCAAAERPRRVRALVCRGGHLDQAAGALSQVLAPTLLLVGELDREVLRLNLEAARKMPVAPHLEVVPRATHKFEEAGKLDIVAREGRDWFLKHLPEPTPQDLPG